MGISSLTYERELSLCVLQCQAIQSRPTLFFPCSSMSSLFVPNIWTLTPQSLHLENGASGPCSQFTCCTPSCCKALHQSPATGSSSESSLRRKGRLWNGFSSVTNHLNLSLTWTRKLSFQIPTFRWTSWFCNSTIWLSPLLIFFLISMKYLTRQAYFGPL